MHTRWVVFLQKFSFMVKQRTDRNNRIVDALSNRTSLLPSVHNTISRLHSLTGLYATDKDLSAIWKQFQQCLLTRDYSIQQEFLFKGNHLCIPGTSLHQQIILDYHGGGLVAHGGRDRTLELVQSIFYWSKLRRDLHNIQSSTSLPN